MSGFNAQQYNQLYQQHNTGVVPMHNQQPSGFDRMNQMLNQKNQQQQQNPNQGYFNQQQQYHNMYNQQQHQQFNPPQYNQQGQQQFQPQQNQNQYNNSHYFPQNIQQQQYNNNVYQMQIQQIQKNYQQQQDFKNPQQQNVVQQQLQQLGGYFKYQLDTTSGQQPGYGNTILGLEVSSQGSNKIPLKIELSNQFPKQKPVIHVKRKLSHKYIDSNSWEVIYASFYQWNENSRLVDLVNKIQQEFINHMPAQDPLLLEIENLKSKVNEDQQALALQQTQLNNMFPGLQNGSVKAEDLLKKDGYHEEVQKLESYKKLQGFILELGQKLEFLSNQLDNQAQAINSKKQLLQQQDEQFEAQKSLHLKLHKDSQLLQERFSSNTILSVLDQEIQRLEEITMNQEEIEVEGPQFQDFLKEYHQNKKDFYKLQIKRAKYTQNV